mgnify:FL=1
MKMRTVQCKVLRREWWYPDYMVPAELTDDEAQEYIQNECPDEVYDEYCNKYTYEQECFLEIIPANSKENAA